MTVKHWVQVSVSTWPAHTFGAISPVKGCPLLASSGPWPLPHGNHRHHSGCVPANTRILDQLTPA